MEFDGEKIERDYLEFEFKVPENYSYEEFSRGVVYVYTEIDEELKREAYARELVRRIQEMRKELDLNVEEFIVVTLEFDEELVKGFEDYIKTETRAKELIFGKAEGYVKEWDIEGERAKIGIKRLNEA